MQATRFAAAVLLLAALAATAAQAEETFSSPARSLLQSGTSCPTQIPGCTARRCTTRTVDGFKDRYVCLRCRAGFVPALSSNRQSIIQCICPAGTYKTGDGLLATCQPCTQGNFCPGGDKKGDVTKLGEQTSCSPNGAPGLTTRSTKATKAADCVATGGYVLPKKAGDPAVMCSGATYAPVNNRLSACLKCQSGLGSPADYNGTRADRNQVCQVPPGRFWELNVVRDCPKGLYRADYKLVTSKDAIACLPCPTGWTTAGIATPSVNLCNVLVAGYKVESVNAGEATIPDMPTVPTVEPPVTEECPVGYYFDGATPTSVYGCTKCISGTTRANGSISAADCVVPPGYYVSEEAGMTKCQNSYRPGWVAVTAATGVASCLSCGTGIKVNETETDELPGADSNSLVAATASKSCYIEAGWGITFDPEDFTKFRAIAPCPANTYGVNSTTYGLINAPCKACTKNTFSTAGATSFQDCQNKAGFGYTSEGANQCPPGWWAAEKSMQPCVQCPPCRTTGVYTPGVGTNQASEADCLVAPGCGVDPGENPEDSSDDGPADKCPIGSYGAGLLATSTCTECPVTQSTSQTGATECDVCAPGYGNPASTTNPTVDGCATCPYGTYSDGDGLSCTACPSTTFNHEYGVAYTSDGITFNNKQTSAATCVPRYAQLPSPAGQMMSIKQTLFTPSTGVTLDACVTGCGADQVCIQEFHSTSDAAAATGDCKRLVLAPVAATDAGAKLFYKLPPSELIAASSTNATVKAKTQSSGIYAVGGLTGALETAAAVGDIGTSPYPEDIEAEKDVVWNQRGCTDAKTCKAACDALATCWGFIEVPGSKFAIRGGESQIGVRTFVASPAPADVSDIVATW